MRIAVFAHTGDVPNFDTGVTTYNRELIRHLCTKFPQHSFTIYLAKLNSAKFADIEFANLAKIVMPSNALAGARLSMARRMVSYLSFAVRETLHRLGLVRHRMQQPIYELAPKLGQHELVIYTVFGLFPDFPLYVERALRIPCIAAIHDIRVWYAQAGSVKERIALGRGRYLLSRTLREAHAALVPSMYIRNVLAQAHGSDSERIWVSYVVPEIYPSTHRDRHLSARVQELLDIGRRYLFYPSTIVETKNHRGLIRAIELLRSQHPDICLVLAGSNTESDLGREMFRFIAEHDLQHNVLHFGFVSEEDKQALYQSAVALVIPSIGESFSLPIWEAFALGCAVIASTDRDIPEQVGDAALPCDPHDPRDIAAKIWLLWTDAQLRQELIERGRNRYEKVRRDSLFTGWELAFIGSKS